MNIQNSLTINYLLKATQDIIRTLNKNKYRRYYIHRYRSYIYLNLTEPRSIRRVIGQYDRKRFNFIHSFIKRNMVCIDVGANLGDYTFCFANLVGERGKVYSYEPEKTNAKWIRLGIEENNYKNIEFHEKAVCDKEGNAELYIGKQSGWHTLKAGKINRNFGKEIVRTVRLDDFNFDRVDFLKIDVEGAEGEVVKGATKIFAHYRPVIQIDLHPLLGVDVEEIKMTLRGFGYRRLEPVGIWFPKEKI